MPLVVYVVRRYRVYASAPARERLTALFASLVMALLHETVSNLMYYLPRHVFHVEQFTKVILHRIINFYPAGIIDRLIEYWILYAIFSAIEFQSKFRDKQIELAQVEGQLFGAQLNALRLQLQPHFLFNTLNTISSLMEIDIKGAQRIVSKLGSLLRGVLDKDKRNLIPLREELDFIKSYLDIEQARFNDRLSIHYHIDDITLNALVPSLVLQPLVENAIKHGFARKIGKGEIHLHTERINDKIIMRIKDDGKGTEQDTTQLLSAGIGLKNVQERLSLLYKDQYTFDIQSAPGLGFEVNISIPYQRQEG
jgi:LytS/YehU family sensor histidine kinase